MNRLIDEISGMMSAHSWEIRAYDESFLMRSVEKRVEVCRLASTTDYLSLLAEDPHEAQIYFNSLQNSYSEFFRDPLTFAILERYILPELIMEKKNKDHSEVRIWSPGSILCISLAKSKPETFG